MPPSRDIALTTTRFVLSAISGSGGSAFARAGKDPRRVTLLKEGDPLCYASPMTTLALTAAELAHVQAASATLRASCRDRFERDVAALVGRGMSVVDAIRLCVGIVPATDEQVNHE